MVHLLCIDELKPLTGLSIPQVFTLAVGSPDRLRKSTNRSDLQASQTVSVLLDATILRF